MATDTLLTVCNQTLLNCGERPLVNTNNTTGIRVKNAVRTALSDVETLYDWSWARKEVNALSWSGGIATLDNVQRVKGVYWRDAYSDKILRPEPYAAFRRKCNGVGTPNTYCIINDRQVGIRPYPSTITNQANVIFSVVVWVSIPSTDSGIFDYLPDTFVDLLVLRASAIFALTGNNDGGLAAGLNSAYETLAQRLRDRYRNTPSDGLSMYRGFR